jgi:hypothetical protein
MADNQNQPTTINIVTSPETQKAATGIVAWFKKFGGWILLGLAAVSGLVIFISNWIGKLAQKKITTLEEKNKDIQKDLDVKKADNDAKIESEKDKIKVLEGEIKKNNEDKAKEFKEIQGKPSEIIKSINDNFGG